MVRQNTVVLPETDEQARAKRAVQRFRAMLPGLNGYVRAITGSPTLYIEIAAGQPRTDGRKIYFEPPIQLGDDLTHERRLCDKRDPETMQQLCYGCAVREDLHIKIYHEMAHNIHGTFQMLTVGHQLKQKIYQEINKLEPKRAKQIQDSLWTVPAGSYLELAGQVNPFLPVLVNALEDLRVDEAMFKARKGTRVMFYAMTRNIFVNGIPELDGSVTRWKDMPLNSQVLVGVFVVGCGYNHTGWFHPKVEKALRDKEIQSLVKDVDEMKSSLETFERAFPILERLRQLGFCLTEEEYDEKEQEDGDGDSDGEDEPSEEGGGSGGDGDDQSSDEAPDESDSEAPSDAEGDDSAGGSDEGSSQAGRAVEDDAAQQVQESSDEVQPQRTGDGEDHSSGGEESERKRDADDAVDSDDDRHELGDKDESGSGRGTGEGEEGEGDEGSPGESGHSDQASTEPSPASDIPTDELTDEESSSSREDREEERDDGGDDVLDTGADEGRGGLSLKDFYGTAEQAEDIIHSVTKHGDHTESATGDQRVEERTIVQSIYFEKESGTVSSVKEHFYGDGCSEDAWSRSVGNSPAARRRRGIAVDSTVKESDLGPALLQMRRAFADNARAKTEPHLRSGRVNARVLGKRAPFHDPRLFKKLRVPGKKSYAVLLGIDISGSTIGKNIALAKLSAFAQAELLHRMGIDFAVYAHSATPVGGMHTLDMYCIKDFDAPWDKKAEKALLEIGSWSENLDGHSLEFYRKKIERHPATDKIILYYTDGKMPAANYSEELTVLQREIKTCFQKSITLLGVGIRTDSPKRHGLDTVQVDEPEDVVKVVQHLESRILHRR